MLWLLTGTASRWYPLNLVCVVSVADVIGPFGAHTHTALSSTSSVPLCDAVILITEVAIDLA